MLPTFDILADKKDAVRVMLRIKPSHQSQLKLPIPLPRSQSQVLNGIVVRDVFK